MAHLKDLPNELLVDEILSYGSTRDVLTFCQTDKQIRTLCSNKKLWMKRFRNYGYLDLQAALKLWAWSGVLPETLIETVIELKERVELNTFYQIFLYFVEQGEEGEAEEQGKQGKQGEQGKQGKQGEEGQREEENAIKIIRIAPAKVKDRFLKYTKIFDFTKRFISSIKLSSFYRAADLFIRRRSRLQGMEKYFDDLIVNNLNDEDLRYVLSEEFSHLLDKASKEHMIKYGFVNGVLGSRYGYISSLLSSAIGLKRISVTDDLFIPLWMSKNGEYTIEIIYESITLEDEMAVLEWVTGIDATPVQIEIFMERPRGNRGTLINAIETMTIDDLLEDGTQILDLAYRLIEPKELIEHLLGRGATIKQIEDELRGIARVVSRPQEGYPLWARIMKEELDRLA